MRIFLKNKRKFLLVLLCILVFIATVMVFFRISNKTDEETFFEAPASEQKRHAFLLNISEERFINHFGPPIFTYEEHKHSMIQYRNDDCIMSVYFIRNKQDKKISKKVLFRKRQTLEYQEDCKEDFKITSFMNN